MFKVGKVINFYEKIGITIVELTANLTVGDTIKIYKDGEEILTQYIDKILFDQKNIPFAKPGDVVGLHFVRSHFVIGLDENDKKIQKGSEVYRLGQLGARS